MRGLKVQCIADHYLLGTKSESSPKIKAAQEYGASGVILYSDPREDGSVTVENGYLPYGLTKRFLREYTLTLIVTDILMVQQGTQLLLKEALYPLLLYTLVIQRLQDTHRTRTVLGKNLSLFHPSPVCRYLGPMLKY